MRESLHFEDTVAAALESCSPGTIHLASVSGGADSTAMLVALASLRERCQVRCIHVEHGIRQEAESRGDAEFVRSLCKKYDIPCRIVSVKPGKVVETAGKRGIGIEAAARLYRRRAWFREAARLGDGTASHDSVRILVAHTADDMLETVLMRILRGAGPSGLAAMPANRGRILRPLLALSRQDVLSYLAQKNIPWREDSTNTDTRYLRNRVRHRLIPMLADGFPQWRRALSSLAETQSLTADFIVNEANLRVKWQVMPGTESFTQKADAGLYTSEGNFLAQPAIIREEALFQGIDTLLAGSQTHEVKRSNIRRFSQGKVSALDLGRVRLRRKDGMITLSRQRNATGFTGAPKATKIADSSEYGFSLLIITPGFYTLKGIAVEVVCGNLTCGNTEESVFFATLPLVLRPSFKEDRIGQIQSGGGKVVSAVDSQGIAAFIGMNGLLERRCGVSHVTNECMYVIKVKTERSTRGINVQRSKR